MKRIAAAVLGASLAMAGAAQAEQSVPIEPGAAAQLPPASAQPAQPDLSQINPTAGPAKAKKAVHAKRPATKPVVAHAAANDRREVQALNWLEADGYRDFSGVYRVGLTYQATVADQAGPYTVTVNPANGHAEPASKAVDRETKALNLINQQGFGEVSAIQPAKGGGFLAKVAHDGQQFDVFADPDHDTVMRLN